MPKYQVFLGGMIYSWSSVVVEARNKDEAAEKALDQAYELGWELESQVPDDPEVVEVKRYKEPDVL